MRETTTAQIKETLRVIFYCWLITAETLAILFILIFAPLDLLGVL